MYVDISRVVACSQQAAFDYMADPRNDPSWWEAVLHTTVVSTTTHGVGTTYQQRCKLMGHSFDVGFVVTAYDRPSMLRLETTSGAVRFEADWQSSFNDTLVKAIDSGGNLRSALASWQGKLEAAAKTTGYTVG
jgi:hypothetical protein